MFIRQRHLIGLVATAMFVLGLANVASASAATQHWYLNGTKAPEGVPEKVAPSVRGPMEFNYTTNKYLYRNECFGTGPSSITVENPVGGGAGTMKGEVAITCREKSFCPE